MKTKKFNRTICVLVSLLIGVLVLVPETAGGAWLLLVGSLMVASLLMAWFNSTLSAHVVHLLVYLHVLKGPDDYIESAMQVDDYDSFATWIIVTTKGNLLSTLLTCSVCLSFHLAFWVSLFFVLFVGAPVTWLVVGTLSMPIVANIGLNILKKI
ncbi:MAG: hypothetical protein RR182_00495 [Alistipes sp.]